MKKLLLAVGLSVVASVVAPVASASAARFTGACVIKGTAEFGGKHLSKTTIESGSYEFTSSAPTVCAHVPLKEAERIKKEIEESQKLSEVETAVLNTVTESGAEEATAQVDGEEAKLGCSRSAGGWGTLPEFGNTGAPGDGEIVLKKGGKAEFTNFKFLGTGTEVHFVAGEAAGEASFAADSEGVKKCVEPGVEGPTKLEFVAVTAGVIG